MSMFTSPDMSKPRIRLRVRLEEVASFIEKYLDLAKSESLYRPISVLEICKGIRKAVAEIQDLRKHQEQEILDALHEDHVPREILEVGLEQIGQACEEVMKFVEDLESLKPRAKYIHTDINQFATSLMKGELRAYSRETTKRRK